MKVLKIASLGNVTPQGNQQVKTIAGLQVFVPANLVDGLSVGEHMVVIDQEITQRRATDAEGNPLEDEQGNAIYEPLDVPTVRKTCTFVGTQEECFEMASEEEMSELLQKEYVTLAKVSKLEELRASFGAVKAPAKKATAETNA